MQRFRYDRRVRSVVNFNERGALSMLVATLLYQRLYNGL